VISTSKLITNSREVENNMKPLGLDANSIYLFNENLLTNISRIQTHQNCESSQSTYKWSPYEPSTLLTGKKKVA